MRRLIVPFLYLSGLGLMAFGIYVEIYEVRAEMEGYPVGLSYAFYGSDIRFGRHLAMACNIAGAVLLILTFLFRNVIRGKKVEEE